MSTKIACIFAATIISVGSYLAFAVAADQNPAEMRTNAVRAMQAGNFKDAYEGGFARLAVDPADDPAKVSEDLTNGIMCLIRLGRGDEVDGFREKTIAAHVTNWRLLETAAQSCINGETYGFIVAGQFYRGNHRGNDGKQVMTLERDRVRALQLMQQATAQQANEGDKNAVGQFYFNFAEMILDNRYGNGAWRLQYLTDLTKLPDYEEGFRYYNGNNVRGAPVNPDGTPVFHKLPRSWADAATDGERWRWCLDQASHASPGMAARSTYVFADFLRSQFDVQTMANSGFGRFVGRGRGLEDGMPRAGGGGGSGPTSDDDTRKDESGPYAVRTLTEDETIARLANGIKRFKLPFEFNFIRLFQSLGDVDKSTWGEQSLNMLGQIFEDRQQYDRSAEYWKKSIAGFGPGPNNWKPARLDQIVGNWGQFDPLATAPAGKDPTAYLLFRNGNHVHFEAFEIDVQKVLNDVKAYLKTRPGQIDWQAVNIDNLGYRLVEQNQQQYVIRQAAKWEMELKPREKHFDKRVKVDLPIKAPGAYLIVGKMDGGNTTRVILWEADTVIAKKNLDGGAYYFLADAVTGAPIGKTKLDFFGYQQKWSGGNKYELNFKDFTATTDADGQAKIDGVENGFNWLVTADAGNGRMAYYGWSNLWSNRYYDPNYNQKKVFVITDRPVYRPGQTVKFKFWLGTAKYDQEGGSEFAEQPFTVQLHNPRGEKVQEKSYQSDGYGGFDGEYTLPKDATLGVYAMGIENFGGSNFRVEEYKKPEFEVSVDAPTEPVMLGEKITATIKAKYYFGTPVVNAKVHYKVMRQAHSAEWFPRAAWDWYYEPGYWWFAYDYNWYPGFHDWGMRAPYRPWWGNRFQQPEIVSENDVPVGPDGTVKVEIDTAPVKAIHGDQDHKYAITAEVTDQSRRTIVGSGDVLVARKPFQVYAWVNSGYFTTGDVIEAQFAAQTLDNKPVVKAPGELKLFKVAYAADGKPVETEVQKWDLATNEEGKALEQIKAVQPGQYRLSYRVTDAKKHAIEGGYVFVVRGEGFDGHQFRFNDIELVTDKKEYQPGDKVKLMINTERPDSTVVLFLRPTSGVYLAPQVIHLKGKSTVQEVAVVKKDMPNFFIEAFTIGDAKLFSDLREVVVPPEDRVINVAVIPSSTKYKPGEKAKVQFKLTDPSGKPVVGSAVVSIYDKAVEYISGGSNVPEIKSFFWKWRRNQVPQTESSLFRVSGPVLHTGEVPMQFLGSFGYMVADLKNSDRETDADSLGDDEAGAAQNGAGLPPGGAPMAASAKGMGGGRGLQSRMNGAEAQDGAFSGGPAGSLREERKAAGEFEQAAADKPGHFGGAGGAEETLVTPTVRKNFADTALWVGKMETRADGTAEVELAMPENLTTWKTRVWTMGQGTRVGQGDAEVVTYKNLIVRLQAPRFFVQKDEVVLSANVHNYLAASKKVKATLNLGDGVLAFLDGNPATQSAEIPPNGEKRIDWRVKVLGPGEATVKVAALTDEESDAMQMSFPAYIHGMLKTDSFAGGLRPSDKGASLTFNVPQARLPDQSRVEIRYSPSVASAMVDALPYLVDYPYGCTEQTLNRFVPTVITQKVLLGMHLDLKAIEQKRTNLNAQEIGDDVQRAKDWKRNNPPNPGVRERNPVFDVDTVNNMTRDGVEHLANMQLGDGGWGWFSGFGEQSYPHTTALVVHGLQIAQENGVRLPGGMLERGANWLKGYQALQLQLLKNAPTKTIPWKDHADNIDAFVYMVLGDSNLQDKEMMEFIYRDRNEIAAYGKAMYGLAMLKQNQQEKLKMILQNLSQYVVQDDENQTAYLRLPPDSWWYWYGSETEAMGYYLKLLSRTDVQGPIAPRLAKYMITNRKHGSYWDSTRDTAVCIEALADYIKASGEDKPDMTVAVSIDGKKMKEVHIGPQDLFTFDNKLIVTGADVTSGAHKIEFLKNGVGPLYFNAYVTNFTLEDPIKKTGLEIRVQRKFYKLIEVIEKSKAAGTRGQPVDERVEKYRREELPDGATLKSGDLVEIELEIDSKNDYEYILFEDMKAAGFEPVEVRSGYNGNDLNAYMELRDERVCFFTRALARGKHSVAYRLRAEIPGKFSALPTKASAMYAPELKANSDEMKIGITD